MTLDDAIKLLKRMLDPEDLGWAVTNEVREEIRKLMKKEEHESLHRTV